MKNRTITAIRKYGKDICTKAYDYSQNGEGPSNIGFILCLTTRQADCAIDAGRDIEHSQDNAKWAF